MSDCTIPAGRVNGQGHDIHTYCANNTAQPPSTTEDASTEATAGQTAGTPPERTKRPRKRRMLGHVPMVLLVKAIGLMTAMLLFMVPIAEIVKILVELGAKVVFHYLGL
jgi:hypothetical protein